MKRRIALVAASLALLAFKAAPAGRHEALFGYYAPIDDDGQYHVMAHINGHPIGMMVDSGSYDISLSEADATRLELPAGGVKAEYVMADGRITSCRVVHIPIVQLGTIVRRNLQASVCEKGSDAIPLLGANFINTTRVTMTKVGITFQEE